MIIDIYNHLISKSVGKLMEMEKYYGEGKQFSYPVHNGEPEVRLAHMDKYKVDIQALSQTPPVLLGFGAEHQAEICRLSNTDNYALCKAYPKRFVNVCMISLLDMNSAMKELNRSINELDCRAVTIASNQNGIGLDAKEFFPFYKMVAEHDLPILIHPTSWNSYPLVDMGNGWRMMHAFGWPFDTTQAVWRLIFGGVIDEFPSLKIVLHHMGGMLPFFARRAEMSYSIQADKLPRHISEYWGNLYGDTATDGTLSSYPCGYAFFGPDRMMYGSDYPFGPEAGEDFIRSNLEGVKAMNIPEEEKTKIFSGNAKELLKIN